MIGDTRRTENGQRTGDRDFDEERGTGYRKLIKGQGRGIHRGRKGQGYRRKTELREKKEKDRNLITSQKYHMFKNEEISLSIR
jgi:hypothetical protein